MVEAVRVLWTTLLRDGAFRSRILKGRAIDALLDSYETERIGFARRLVATTDRVFTFATGEGELANFVRTKVAPIVIPAAFSLPAVRKFAFRTVSQTMLNYRGSPLSRGKAGRVRGGDRLPWVKTTDADNFSPLVAMDWQIQVFGSASPEVVAWCVRRGLPLNVFAWQAECATAGLARDAVYLVRPDTYVALADPSGGASALTRYFAELAIKPVP